MAKATFFVWAIAGALCGSTAQGQLTITDLGVLPGDLYSNANAVNANGTVVVGTSSANGVVRGFRWTSETGLVDLGFLAPGHYLNPKAVSADGSVIAGEALNSDSGSSSASRAFRWTSSGGVQDLGLLGGQFTFAQGISGDGNVIVGTADPITAFKWTSGSGMQSLGLFSTAFGALGYAANQDGSVIVGYAGTSNGQRAFRWTPGTGMQSIGVLPGASASFATAVSADGNVIVGYSYIAPGGVSHPFRWTASGGMEDIGTLPGGVYVYANGVSGDGSIVVGTDSTGSSSRLFLWRESDGMHDLTELLTSMGVDLTVWTLYSVTAISADGFTIVGDGAHNGESRAWKFVFPSDTCEADFNHDGIVDFFDYLDFVNAFASMQASADFNRDGVIDFFDYLDFVNQFSTGC